MTDLAIVRRYVDMNGRYVGELYLNGTMIGASLDNLPLEYAGGRLWFLDTWRSFLSPLTWRTVRVGGTDPTTDKATRWKVRRLPPFGLRLRVENNFAAEVRTGIAGKGDVTC